MYYLYQAVPSLPDIPVTNEDNILYAWIIGVLILFIFGLFWKIKNVTETYENKLKDIQLRLDHVIDESIDRMERKDDLNRNYVEKLSVLITKLHEILVIINR
jgi:hypothetical protein